MKLIEADPTLIHRPNFGSGLSRRVLSLWQKELASLTLGELALCLRQAVALPHVIPLALAALSEQPLVEAELYPGDLLISLLHTSDRATLSAEEANELYDICAKALAGADTIAASVVPAALQFVGRNNRS